jgi:hypothetical protein
MFSTERDSERPQAAECKEESFEFRGTGEPREAERRLVQKIDLRMSILVLIYILNFVCFQLTFNWH